ncbi:aminotransferase-like domain-containing protein [Prosthecomicrobium sp. N25]|uniref:aminotransferase-like domain-containing protein n=1 Tax=Prosthecomicrobium sp. N25 TaxID=3129254 RepID=UPI00307774EB
MDDRVAQAEPAGTLVEQVMREVRQRIARRATAAGVRLPSIRAQAQALGVSKSTVVEAYDRLAAEGVIRSRPGSGYFVAGHLPPLSLADIGPRLDRAVDPLWVSRQSLEAGDTILKPGCGWLPPSWMPGAAMRKCLRGLARGDDSVLADYGPPLGHPGLRQVLSRRLAERAVEATPDQILLTDSGTQALDLVCRFLLEPGDTVLVDDPCYFNFLALLRAHRARVVGVPFTPTGPDVERFAAALAEHRPRLYLTNATLHNPTGATLSPVVAHRILTLAAEAGLTIVEDDIFADFEERPTPRLAAFDGLDRVLHIGSFSKTLSASVRCGFVAARPDWIEALADLRIATAFGGGRFAAAFVQGVLTDGSYRKHMEGVRQRLARAMAETARRLEGLGIRPWTEPNGGLFLWCSLPDGLDAGEVARRALADGVVLAPGNAFSLSGNAGRFLRFNVAQCGDPRIPSVLARAMGA